MKTEITEQLIEALSAALKALNTAPRFKVSDTDSYVIASQAERALKAAKLPGASHQTYRVTYVITRSEVYDIEADSENDARSRALEEGTRVESLGETTDVTEFEAELLA